MARPESEGDCTAVDGHDGYWYAYCMRRRDNKSYRRARSDRKSGSRTVDEMERTRLERAGPGGVPAPALIGYVGTSSAYWTEGNVILLVAPSASFRLSISEDKVHFATVAEPLILYDEDNWQRPAPTELYAYPSMVADQGFNNIARSFFPDLHVRSARRRFQSAISGRAGGVDPGVRGTAISAGADSFVTMGRFRWRHMDHDGAARYRRAIPILTPAISDIS